MSESEIIELIGNVTGHHSGSYTITEVIDVVRRVLDEGECQKTA